jgi:hypothetical protein
MAIGSKKRPQRASSMAKEADLGVGRRGGFIFWHVAAEANTKASPSAPEARVCTFAGGPELPSIGDGIRRPQLHNRHKNGKE